MPTTTSKTLKEKLFSFSKHPPRVPLQDMVVFLKEFSTLTESGVPVVQTIDALINQTSNKHLKNALISVRYDIVKGGLQFHQAFGKFPNIFPVFFLGMVQIGEMTGNLSGALAKLLYWYEKELNMRIKLISVLTYPAMVTLICIACLVLIMKFVLPQIISFLQVYKGQLPLPTRILIYIEKTIFMNNLYLVLIILLVLGFIYFIYKLQQSSRLRLWFFQYLAKFPVVSNLYHKILLARFCKSLHFLLLAGVELEASLKISGLMVKNSIYKEKIDHIIEKLREGETLAASFKEVEAFPAIMEGCIAAGEEIGNLSVFLMHISNLYEMEIDILLEQVVALIEPLIILGLGLFTGFIVISIFMPIYSIT